MGSIVSSKEYLAFILEQLSELEEISYGSMMVEYILYYRREIISGIYDNRSLLKPVKAGLNQLGQPRIERPYEGAKEMILLEELEDRSFLASLIRPTYLLPK